MRCLVAAACLAVLVSGSAQAYQVMPDPFGPFSTDQSTFYWSGDAGGVNGIAMSGADFSSSPAPGLGDVQWEITAPGGGIILEFIQVYSPIEQSDYLLRDNGAAVPWDNVDNPGGQYSYNNLFDYYLSPGLHVITVEVLGSSGSYFGGLEPLGPDLYSWAVMTFNTDPGVAPAVPLPASGLALAGGMIALIGLKGRRRH